MIRQSLDADSAYVDVALHGDGLTSLQFRDAQGSRHPRSAGQYPERPSGCESRSVASTA